MLTKNCRWNYPEVFRQKCYFEEVCKKFTRNFFLTKLNFCEVFKNTRFFTSNTFISNVRLKLAKNQANDKQHPEAKLLTKMSK